MSQINWLIEKPEFTKDCILICATWWQDKRKHDYWEYTLYEVKKTEGVDSDGNPAWYWGLFCQDGDEWGDIADLTADKYLILEPLTAP